MSKVSALLVCVFLVGLLTGLSAAPPAEGWSTSCKIVRVIDGDTVDVEVTKTVRIRMLDCWCPETRTTDREEKARGLAAKTHLQNLVDSDRDGRQVLFVPMGDALKDSLTLDRVLGYLWLSPDAEKSISELQCEAGHATKVKP